MAGLCPTPAPDDPIVHSLLSVVDCNTQGLVHSGYAALFSGSSPFTGVLTALLTLYVGLIGYRLMLGYSQLRVSDFAMTALKIGAVLALTTQWETYQALVYRLLFDGPQQLAGAMLSSVQPDHSAFGGDVFESLQRAFDDLSGSANGYASHSPAQSSPLLGGAGFGAIMLTFSASVLLLSSLGVLLAAKIVLALLLAIGPLFIALALFDSTRGLFEGWVRASIAFGFAPFASIMLLGIFLIMLEPSLLQMEDMRKHGVFVLGPVYSVATLILVFAGVSLGALIAGAMVSSGFRLPGRALQDVATPPANELRQSAPVILSQPREKRVAAAVGAMDRRDRLVLSSVAEPNSVDRRIEMRTSATQQVSGAQMTEVRLGQGPRRIIRPRAPRPTARSA